MNPGQANIVECPHCKSHKEIMCLLSGNTFEAEVWSDNKVIYPMLPKASFIQKCPNCGKYFFLYEKNIVGKSRNISMDTGALTYYELKEVYYDVYCNENSVLNDHEKSAILWEILWSFNDKYKRQLVDEPAHNSVSIHKLEQLYIETIVKDLLKYVEDHLMKAELYREIEHFDEALKEITLCKSFDEKKSGLIKNCLNLINRHNSQVVDITDILVNGTIVDEKTPVGKSKYTMPLSKDPTFFKDLAELMKIIPSTSENITILENELSRISQLFFLPKDRIYSKLVSEIEDISKAGETVKQSILNELSLLIEQVGEKPKAKNESHDIENKIKKKEVNDDLKNGEYRSLFSSVDINEFPNIRDQRTRGNDNSSYKDERLSSSNISNENNFFLVKLYNGKYSLALSFWLYGIVVFIVIYALGKAIPREIFLNRGVLAAVMMIDLIYRIIWSVGTIKSGLSYKGFFIIKWLVITLVCIFAVIYIFSFFGTLMLLG